MSSIQERLNQSSNPANAPAKAKETKGRIPMSVPEQKLAVPDIPGFHLHWMLGTPQRLQQAEKAGYTFVQQDEVELNTVGLADNPMSDGHNGLDSRVSVASGKEMEGSQPQRLYLMKLPEQFWQEDQAKLAQRNEAMAATLRGDGIKASEGDNAHRYIPNDAGNKYLFHPKPKR